MPSLTRDEQRVFGGKIAELMQPFPRDERLLMLIACFYGEARSQGLNASAMRAMFEHVTGVHERGQTIELPEGPKCPACGGAL